MASLAGLLEENDAGRCVHAESGSACVAAYAHGGVSFPYRILAGRTVWPTVRSVRVDGYVPRYSGSHEDDLSLMPDRIQPCLRMHRDGAVVDEYICVFVSTSARGSMDACSQRFCTVDSVKLTRSKVLFFFFSAGP